MLGKAAHRSPAAAAGARPGLLAPPPLQTQPLSLLGPNLPIGGWHSPGRWLPRNEQCQPEGPVPECGVEHGRPAPPADRHRGEGPTRSSLSHSTQLPPGKQECPPARAPLAVRAAPAPLRGWDPAGRGGEGGGLCRRCSLRNPWVSAPLPCAPGSPPPPTLLYKVVWGTHTKSREGRAVPRLPGEAVRGQRLTHRPSEPPPSSGAKAMRSPSSDAKPEHFLLLFLLLVTPTACGSQARDRTGTTAVARAAAATMLDPSPLRPKRTPNTRALLRVTGIRVNNNAGTTGVH